LPCGFFTDALKPNERREKTLKLSQTTSYALSAVLKLATAEPGVPVSCSELAKGGRLPQRFLLQILRALVDQRILCSKAGVEGGYYLNKSPKQITLLDIVECFDSSSPPRPPSARLFRPDVRAKLSTALDRATAAMRRELQLLTMADLLEKRSRRPNRAAKTKLRRRA
jgi:Rrf2 family protein